MSTAELKVRVAKIQTVAENIKRVRLVAVAGGDLPNYSAGSHIVVTMRGDGKTIKNPYSLMGPISDFGGYEITVLKTENSHGGSRFIHEHLNEGDEIAITQPSNLFPLDLRGRKHLLIAGGIGITPIMAMADQLAHLGGAFEIHYSTRTPRSGAYVNWLKTRYNGHFHHYQTDSGPRMDLTGMLSQQPLGTHLYVCGPEAMIEDVLERAKAAGWPSQHVHAEHFTTAHRGAPFEVVLAKTGRTIRVKEDESILTALESAGLEPQYLCRGGACGQCETSVVGCEGSIAHHDHYLSEEDKTSGKKIMICVSRLNGPRITLDL